MTRLPAAWCGVIGFKPIFGAVSLRGCAPMAPSVNTVGVLAGCVRDCALTFAALRGVASPPAHAQAPEPLRIGALTDTFTAREGEDQRVAQACLRRLASSSSTVRLCE